MEPVLINALLVCCLLILALIIYMRATLFILLLILTRAFIKSRDDAYSIADECSINTPAPLITIACFIGQICSMCFVVLIIYTWHKFMYILSKLRIKAYS